MLMPPRCTAASWIENSLSSMILSMILSSRCQLQLTKVLRDQRRLRRTIVHMPNSSSHSSQIRHIQSRDGSLGIGRYRTDRKQVDRRRSLGPLLGDDLLTWVIKPETDAQKRVEAILNLIVELRAL